MTGPRILLLRAQDAPAPTIVIDGVGAGVHARRADCEVLAADARTAAFAEHPYVDGLGVKTIVLLPPRDGVTRVEFFQGVAHGDLMPGSQQVCINSLACAVTAAADSYPDETGSGRVLALMGDQSYVVRRRA